MGNTLKLSITIDEAVDLIYEAVVNGSITGELIDKYEINSLDNKKCIVMIFDKHYYRAGNRLTLTVVIDNLQGNTRVHYTGGGGGQGLFKFDWGAASSFEDIVHRVLGDYIV
ncbi:DUF6054 family protein [Wansuia hejianensis]|uniref:Uncharacterized protein n=1 Tax=Wansuia hejianensis TaxID=2763667 RepID=A0A926F0Y9_9FIRM|nr:DUF6054 family protein [Wansuia hejianensis]MBC8589884.1 hypothetical protein [Wansuia hejianensis]